MMFNVGDKVVGNANNGYTFTNDQCILQVMSVDEVAGKMDCEVIGHKEKKYNKLKGQKVEDLSMADFHKASIDEIAEFEPKKRESKEKAEKSYSFRGKLAIKVYADDRIESSFNRSRTMILEDAGSDRVKALKKIMSAVSGVSKADMLKVDIPEMISKDPDMVSLEDVAGYPAVKSGLNNLINFFKEFQFEPSFRLVNTLGFRSGDAQNYIANYFKVTGNQKAEAIIDKMGSPEFKDIINDINLVVPKDRINKRFKIYYGSQGTGKTTLGMEESEGRCCLCNGGILPADMLEDFSFNDGKPGFQGSLLRRCMEEGKPVVLDEFNLLPFETVRFLQGILDGKKQFTYKGETIKIKEGFEIIATMNLTVNGMVFGLPEPLVDRAYEIKEFVLTADNLMSALV